MSLSDSDSDSDSQYNNLDESKSFIKVAYDENINLIYRRSKQI